MLCITDSIIQKDSSGNDLNRVAEMFVRHQVNLILISLTGGQRSQQRRVAEDFIAKIKELSSNLITPLDAILLIQPAAEEVWQVMVKKVANYSMPRNAPLIIETFS